MTLICEQCEKPIEFRPRDRELITIKCSCGAIYAVDPAKMDYKRVLREVVMIDEIKKRWNKATPGPWKAYKPELSKSYQPKTITTFLDVKNYGAIIEYKDKKGKGDYGGMIIFDLGGGCCEDMKPRDHENAIAIAAAPTDIAFLLELLDRATALGEVYGEKYAEAKIDTERLRAQTKVLETEIDRNFKGEIVAKARLAEATALIKEILPLAKWESCMYDKDQDADPSTHCCDWNGIVDEIVAFIQAPEVSK